MIGFVEDYCAQAVVNELKGANQMVTKVDTSSSGEPFASLFGDEVGGITGEPGMYDQDSQLRLSDESHEPVNKIVERSDGTLTVAPENRIMVTRTKFSYDGLVVTDYVMDSTWGG